MNENELTSEELVRRLGVTLKAEHKSAKDQLAEARRELARNKRASDERITQLEKENAQFRAGYQKLGIDSTISPYHQSREAERIGREAAEIAELEARARENGYKSLRLALMRQLRAAGKRFLYIGPEGQEYDLSIDARPHAGTSTTGHRTYIDASYKKRSRIYEELVDLLIDVLEATRDDQGLHDRILDEGRERIAVQHHNEVRRWLEQTAQDARPGVLRAQSYTDEVEEARRERDRVEEDRRYANSHARLISKYVELRGESAPLLDDLLAVGSQLLTPVLEMDEADVDGAAMYGDVPRDFLRSCINLLLHGRYDLDAMELLEAPGEEALQLSLEDFRAHQAEAIQ